MNTSSPGEHGQDALTAEQRRERDLLAMSTTELAATPSWGERLLPYLFIATESCWIAAILLSWASTALFPTHVPLMPLWSPFVLMAGAYWCVIYLERRDLPKATTHNSLRDRSMMTGAGLVYVVFALLLLFVVWVSVYASTAFFFDPRWLLALLGDIFSLNGRAFLVALIAALTYYFCWQGVRLSRRFIEPAMVFGTLRLGVGVLLLAIIVQASAGAAFAQVSLLLLGLPLFFFLALVTHALARVVFLRRSYPFGLQGSMARQERTLFMVIVIVGIALLLIALFVGTFASPAVLAQIQQALSPLGRAYDLLAAIIARIMLVLITPFFWLFSLLHPVYRPPRITIPGPIARNPPHIATTPPAALLVAIPIIKLVLPLLIAIVILLLIRQALRRRRIKLVRRDEDTHESLWSWSLFWTQLKAWLRTLWQHLFPQRTAAVTEVGTHEENSTEPTARNMREIYRAFLAWTAKRGYPRKKSETPYELDTRLHAHLTFAEPQMSNITEAYTATRYGNIVPDEAEVARIRNEWIALQQKAQNN